MIEVLSGFSALLLIAIGWGLGLRLLALARRTRQIPELTIGLGLLFIGGFGYPLALFTNRLAESQPTLSWICMVLGATACHLGLTAHCVFTWKVFRPEAAWARAAVVASVATVLVGFAGNLQVGLGGAATMEEVSSWTFFLMIVATASYGWSAIESFAYHAKLRKRLALGLSEPVIVNRFLLWGTSSAASTLSCVVNGFFVLTSPLSALDPRALVVSGLCGAIGGAVMILTFLPPGGYRRFIEARHAARPA